MTNAAAGGATRKAVVLLSGGLDSATTLAVALAEGYECFCLSFDYGQRHRYELESAGVIARKAGIVHREMAIDLRALGGSALTADIDVPKNHHHDEIPVTYVPARNTIFLSYALGWAEVLEAGDIFIGVNAVDYSGYPDCRPEFIQAFETMANLAVRAAVEQTMRFRIRTPLIHLRKKEIIRKGLSLGVDYAATHSCYDPAPGGLACGQCDSCRLRKKGFSEAGVADPTPYVRESS